RGPSGAGGSASGVKRPAGRDHFAGLAFFGRSATSDQNSCHCSSSSSGRRARDSLSRTPARAESDTEMPVVSDFDPEQDSLSVARERPSSFPKGLFEWGRGGSNP